MPTQRQKSQQLLRPKYVNIKRIDFVNNLLVKRCLFLTELNKCLPLFSIILSGFLWKCGIHPRNICETRTDRCGSGSPDHRVESRGKSFPSGMAGARAHTAVQENARSRVKKCLQCSAEPRDPDTDPGALARCRTACSTAAEKCALQRSMQQSSAAAATCSTEKEERARDLLQTFPRAAAWFPKRGAHTPEPLAAAAGCSRARCARTAEQSAELGGCTSGAEHQQQQQGRAAAAAALIQPVSQP